MILYLITISRRRYFVEFFKKGIILVVRGVEEPMNEELIRLEEYWYVQINVLMLMPVKHVQTIYTYIWFRIKGIFEI